MASIICRRLPPSRRFCSLHLPVASDARMLPEMLASVALITPFAFPSVRGNAVTVARIARGLTARGVAVRVWDRSTLDDATIEAEIGASAPSLVHGFHARHVGPLALRLAHLRLLYAGPILNAEEGQGLLAAIAERPWARYVGTVAHAQIASLLAQTDVVLNCSLSEGGMANSVLEAQALGRAVLA